MIPIIGAISGIINKFIPDKDLAKKLEVELSQEFTKQMEMKSDIIQSEIKNGSGKWRVRLMYLCMFLVTMHWAMYDLVPYIRTAFDYDFYIPQQPDATELWAFLKLGVGGYLASRGVEKSVKHFRG